MRYPIKLIVRKGKVRNDGTALIYLQYCLSAEKGMLEPKTIYISSKNDTNTA